ncbi:Kinesin, motor domain-containing protein [Artemisia annua]|uniref:Kinesin, motor domain-containing protein n=1 Tax=Artemisia annua TaxID=35608 RepID=A0A2U1Q650_ARTAN|nr:Kinesin, motor domain-containing protein [Artemisia annua]
MFLGTGIYRLLDDLQGVTHVQHLIHADETKCSLQVASGALCVTNCVHVNEILTDAALLKWQKKEIDELRAKLQGSHSDHLGEEILNLRKTLLQSELERE